MDKHQVTQIAASALMAVFISAGVTAVSVRAQLIPGTRGGTRGPGPAMQLPSPEDSGMRQGPPVISGDPATRMLERTMTKLTRTMERLQEQLARLEARLAKTTDEDKRMDLQDRIDDVNGLIDDATFDLDTLREQRDTLRQGASSSEREGL